MNTVINYITDNDCNFDFYSELNNVNDNEKSLICLISHQPLTYNSVTLPCKHSFNYLSIYNELCLNINNLNKGSYNKKHIICPYCRNKSEKLLPYIPLPSIKKINGINSPEILCLPSPKCSYLVKTGKKKGMPCNKLCIESEYGNVCIKHNKDNLNIGWSPEKEKLLKTKSVAELKVMLKERGLKITGVKKELVNRLF